MTNRERALNILHFKEVDRMPAVHFGYWKELLIEWADQGHISAELARAWRDGNDADAELNRLIGWDFEWYNVKQPDNKLSPFFEKKVLETLPDGTQRVLSGYGVIERLKPGIRSIPAEDDYLMKDRAAFETLFKPKIKYFSERVNTELFKSFNDTRNPDVPIGLRVGSVLGDIRDMTTVVGMSYLMYDEDEELFAEIIDTYAEMQYQCVEAVLRTGAKFDFAHYWEDICFKNGPLIAPAMFEELCAKHYKKRNDLLHSYGIDLISLDCDGVIDSLVPTWINNGVNVMFPLEVGVWGDQFAAQREKHGKKLLGIGGMDKTAFRKDRAAVDAELERMQSLVDLGGFIPCPDHRIMPGSKFELVRYYAEEVKKLKTYKEN